LSLLYFLAGNVLRPFLGLFARLQPIGLENIPNERGFVIVSNHVGWIDPLWIGLALWPRAVSPMAKKELFARWPLRFILAQLGAFPVTRGAASPSEIRRPLEILQNRGVVLIFPGGTREAQLSGVKRGAATIAVTAGVPVVPIYFDGPGHLRLRDIFRRRTASILVGDPIDTVGSKETSREQRKEAVLDTVQLIEDRLKQLGAKFGERPLTA
jgi:1-acyl-sn-glycerol-3-phosphate acyltransferase